MSVLYDEATIDRCDDLRDESRFEIPVEDEDFTRGPEHPWDCRCERCDEDRGLF